MGQVHEQPESGVSRFRVTVEVDIDVVDPIALRNANLAPSAFRPRGADGRGFDLIGVVTQAVRGLEEAECGIRLMAMSAGAMPVQEGGS